MNAYVPILGLIAVAAVFAVGSVAFSVVAGPPRFNRARLDSYECGIQPTPQPVGGGRFQVKYYLTAMTFIIFDIEIIFLYPWAVRFDYLGVWGFFTMLTFIFLITVPFIYEWRRGGLDWD